MVGEALSAGGFTVDEGPKDDKFAETPELRADCSDTLAGGSPGSKVEEDVTGGNGVPEVMIDVNIEKIVEVEPKVTRVLAEVKSVISGGRGPIGEIDDVSVEFEILIDIEDGGIWLVAGGSAVLGLRDSESVPEDAMAESEDPLELTVVPSVDNGEALEETEEIDETRLVEKAIEVEDVVSLIEESVAETDGWVTAEPTGIVEDTCSVTDAPEVGDVSEVAVRFAEPDWALEEDDIVTSDTGGADPGFDSVTGGTDSEEFETIETTLDATADDGPEPVLENGGLAFMKLAEEDELTGTNDDVITVAVDVELACVSVVPVEVVSVGVVSVEDDSVGAGVFDDVALLWGEGAEPVVKSDCLAEEGVAREDVSLLELVVDGPGVDVVGKQGVCIVNLPSLHEVRDLQAGGAQNVLTAPGLEGRECEKAQKVRLAQGGATGEAG